MDLKVQISENKEQKNSLLDEIKNGILTIPKLLESYRNSDVQGKKKLIGSIFPEKFIFKNNKIGTTDLSEVFALILNYSKGFKKQKSGQNKYFNCLSALVVPLGIEPSTY